jgi:hypothetical protein
MIEKEEEQEELIIDDDDGCRFCFELVLEILDTTGRHVCGEILCILAQANFSLLTLTLLVCLSSASTFDVLLE